jgi:hypothetical protein
MMAEPFVAGLGVSFPLALTVSRRFLPAASCGSSSLASGDRRRRWHPDRASIHQQIDGACRLEGGQGWGSVRDLDTEFVGSPDLSTAAPMCDVEGP